MRWFFIFSLSSLRPDPDCHSAILKIGVNHATCYVYSPKAVETLLHRQCYGYVKYIFFSFYLFLFVLDLKRITNTLKRYLLKPEFLVARDDILAPLVTVPVALSSLLTMYLLTKLYRLTIMWC